MIFKSILLVALFLPTISQADDWVKLTNEGDINIALSGKIVRFDDYSFQVFGKNGKTRYFTERVSDGLWEVRAGQYCSTWPPSVNWTCYDFSLKGERMRFALADGTFSEGYYDNIK